MNRRGSSSATRASTGPAPSGRSRRPLARGLLTVALLAVLSVVLVAPVGAQAQFVRPLLRQITGTSPGAPFCLQGQGSCRHGIAVNGTDNLLLGEQAGSSPQLDEFGASSNENPFLKTIPLGFPPEASEPVELLAINQTTGQIAISAGGTFKGRLGSVELFDSAGVHEGTIEPVKFGGLNAEGLAIDSSSGPSAGSIYVLKRGEPGGIVKFDAAGKEADFTGCPTCSEYVTGDQISGLPGGAPIENPNGSHAPVTVSPVTGALYVLTEKSIAEFASSGEFVRQITSVGVPPIIPGRGGFGGEIENLSVDPTNDDLIVAIRDDQNSQGGIDEFDSTGHLLGQIKEAAGQPIASATGAAVDSEGNLYLDARPPNNGKTGPIDVFGSGGFVPGLRIAAPTARTETDAVLNGAVNPEAELDPEPSGLTACHFEYVTEEEFIAEGFSGPHVENRPCESPDAGEVGEGNGNSFVAVHAAVSNLVSGTTYRYRLSATAEGVHSGGATQSPSTAFTAPHAPAVSGTAADGITSAFAELDATIDPLASDTRYHFEYLTDAAYQANGGSFSGPDAPMLTPEVDIGPGGEAGNVPQMVVQGIGGLTPGTIYHFRVVAENAIEPTVGPMVTFATQGLVSPGLPDGRAYELLTPPDKEGAEDMFGRPETNGEFDNPTNVGVSSVTGDQFLLETRAAFGPSPASSGNGYVFSRHPVAGEPGREEWSYEPLPAPGLGVQGLNFGIGAYDAADLSRVAFDDEVGASESQAGAARTSLLGPPGGPYALLHADPRQTGVIPPSEVTEVVGGAADLSEVMLASNDHSLAPAAAGLDPDARGVFAYTGGDYSLLDVHSDGTLLSPCGAALAADYGNQVSKEGFLEGEGSTYGAVSADGSRAYLYAPDPSAPNQGSGCWNGKTTNAPQLWMRSGGETLEVSAPEPELEGEAHHHEATYVGAAADGSRVFFASEAWLTSDHPSVHDPELYEWEVLGAPGCEESDPALNLSSDGCLRRISAGEGSSPGEVGGAELIGVPAVASSGSGVYFLADGVLASNRGADGTTAGAGGCAAEQIHAEEGGLCNLYRYDTASSSIVYVATVNRFAFTRFEAPGLSVTGLTLSGDWTTTPDGDYLLFKSNLPLTAYSNAGSKCPLLVSGGDVSGLPCSELYRYHYEASSASGGSILCVSCNPSGATPISNARFTRSSMTWRSTGPVRAISDDGSYAFFDTAESLVPQDTNGVGDVYEWHDGAISLISSGTDRIASYFLGASADGSNVFFGTHSRLVPADTDDKGDLYDARICTASDPCISPPPNGEHICEGDACSHPTPAPDRPPLSTSVPKSSANVIECPKGKILKKGQCIAKKQKAKKKHHKKKGTHKKSTSTDKKKKRANSKRGGQK